MATSPDLRDLLAILNRAELSGVWAEDETIGWVYQYFNSRTSAGRCVSLGAPRNSRELAVRNQFFTPRYVVEFLTDNTLGRTWYEMRQGNTALGTSASIWSAVQARSSWPRARVPPT